ncbi:acyltransferase [Flavobacterium oreochromis]|uniref:acyltransferase family protein n=1 Tax=Flavobacterium oreochromis TaxID=2906078 RepID=UPI00385FD4B7
MKEYYPSLTGIRFIAASMVFFHHFNPISNRKSLPFIYDFFTELHVGVTLFFFLSGFLIANRYFDEKVIWKSYFINRFARIYPSFFILTTLTFLYTSYKTNVFNAEIYLSNITFIKGFFNNLKFTGIAQSWSLTVEEFFYLLAPFFFFLIKKRNFFVYFLPIISILLGLIFYRNDITFMLDFTFFCRCFEFFSGIHLALFIKRNKEKQSKNMTYIGTLFTFLGIFWLVYLKPTAGLYGNDLLVGKIINTIFFPLFCFTPLFIGLIREKTIISKFLSTQIIQILGKSSYAFYLIHLGILYDFFHKYFGYWTIFVIINLISILFYTKVETFFYKLIRNQTQLKYN